MILTCPACATRYQADEAKFPPEGRKVRCAKCGHVWHQPGPVAAPEPDVAAITAEPEPDATGRSPSPSPLSSAPARARAQAAPCAGRASPSRWGAHAGRGGGLGRADRGGAGDRLFRGALPPGDRGDLAAIGRGLFQPGHEGEAHGIDFAHVDYHRESEDGQVVLAVTGDIVNNGDRELPVPQSVRVTLSDASNHELYHWNFTPDVQTLKPGQSVALPHPAFQPARRRPPSGSAFRAQWLTQ